MSGISAKRRTNAIDTSPTQTDTYAKTSGTNRLASITSFAGTRSFTYDNRGNPTAEARPSSIAVSVSYDGHGRLTGYTRTGQSNQSNVYNGLDQRVTVTSGSTVRRFVYDPDGRVIGEYGTSATNVTAERIWMNPQVGDAGMFGGDDGAGGYMPAAIATSGGTISWVHANHLGVPHPLHQRQRSGDNSPRLHPPRVPGPAAHVRRSLLQPVPRL